MRLKLKFIRLKRREDFVEETEEERTVRYLREHLDRAYTLLDDLYKFLDKDVEDEFVMKVLKPAVLAHIEMIKGRVGRARYLARKLSSF